MKHYLVSLAAYLSGWVIANAIFIRVVRYVRQDTIDAEHNEWRDKLADRVAQGVSDTLAARYVQREVATAANDARARKGTRA